MKIKKKIEIEINIYKANRNLCNNYCKYMLRNVFFCDLFRKKKKNYRRVKECIECFGLGE